MPWSKWLPSTCSQYTANFAQVGTDLQQVCYNLLSTTDIWMRSLPLPQCQWLINRSVTSCCDRAATMLFSTGLSQVVDTKLQQCCSQQACRKLLTHVTELPSNAVFNNLRHADLLWTEESALWSFVYPLFWKKRRPNRLPYFGCSVHKITRLLYNKLAR